MNSVKQLAYENDHDLAKKVTVLPGWALVRRIRNETQERKSNGGIVLPDEVETCARTNTAVMVKCGQYYDARSGALKGDFEIPTGTVVEVHPGASMWCPSTLRGSDYTVVKSIDLMCAVNLN